MLVTISTASIINACAVVFLVALGVYIGRLATSPVTGIKINVKRFSCFVKKLWGRIDFKKHCIEPSVDSYVVPFNGGWRVKGVPYDWTFVIKAEAEAHVRQWLKEGKIVSTGGVSRLVRSGAEGQLVLPRDDHLSLHSRPGSIDNLTFNQLGVRIRVLERRSKWVVERNGLFVAEFNQQRDATSYAHGLEEIAVNSPRNAHNDIADAMNLAVSSGRPVVTSEQAPVERNAHNNIENAVDYLADAFGMNILPEGLQVLRQYVAPSNGGWRAAGSGYDGMPFERLFPTCAEAMRFARLKLHLDINGNPLPARDDGCFNCGTTGCSMDGLCEQWIPRPLPASGSPGTIVERLVLEDEDWVALKVSHPNLEHSIRPSVEIAEDGRCIVYGTEAPVSHLHAISTGVMQFDALNLAWEWLLRNYGSEVVGTLSRRHRENDERRGRGEFMGAFVQTPADRAVEPSAGISASDSISVSELTAAFDSLTSSQITPEQREELRRHWALGVRNYSNSGNVDQETEERLTLSAEEWAELKADNPAIRQSVPPIVWQANGEWHVRCEEDDEPPQLLHFGRQIDAIQYINDHYPFAVADRLMDSEIRARGLVASDADVTREMREGLSNIRESLRDFRPGMRIEENRCAICGQVDCEHLRARLVEQRSCVTCGVSGCANRTTTIQLTLCRHWVAKVNGQASTECNNLRAMISVVEQDFEDNFEIEDDELSISV